MSGNDPVEGIVGIAPLLPKNGMGSTSRLMQGSRQPSRTA